MNKLKKIIISHIINYYEALIPLEDIYDNLELKLNKAAVLTPKYDKGDETALYNRQVLYNKLCRMKQPMIDLQAMLAEYVGKYQDEINSLNIDFIDTSERSYNTDKEFFMQLDNPLLKDKAEYVLIYYYYNDILKHIIDHGIMLTKIRDSIINSDNEPKYYELLYATHKCIMELEDVIDILTNFEGPNEEFENILLKEIKIKFKKKKKINVTSINETKKQKLSLRDIAALALGTIGYIGSIGSEYKDDTKSELEKEMDLYDLDEEERELVRSGEWEPWQFDTDPDELDEESYYYEDDLR